MKILLPIFLLIMSCNVYSQERVELSSFFFFTKYGIENNSTDFNRVSTNPSCCDNNFSDASGNSFHLGSQYNYLIGSGFYVLGSLEVSHSNSDFSKIEFQEIRDPVTVNAEIEHSINTRVYLTSLSTGLSYKFKALRISGILGFNLFLNGNYDGKEILVSPSNYGTFENGLRTRNQIESGDMDLLNTATFFNEFRMAYDFNLNSSGSVVVSPFLSYRFGFNSRVDNGDLTSSLLNIGIGIRLKELSEFSSPLNPER